MFIITETQTACTFDELRLKHISPNVPDFLQVNTT